jgi:hypothetical protein
MLTYYILIYRSHRHSYCHNGHGFRTIGEKQGDIILILPSTISYIPEVTDLRLDVQLATVVDILVNLHDVGVRFQQLPDPLVFKLMLTANDATADLTRGFQYDTAGICEMSIYLDYRYNQYRS